VALRRIIFHIGRHKSGTSSLQHFFASHRDVLDGQGFLYPFAGIRKNGRAHHELSHMCHTGQRAGSTVDDIIAAVKDELKDHHHTLLFSSEEFQNLASTRWIKHIIRQFGKVDVEIICYVREFADYMMSAYRQAVQNQPKFQTFSTFCEHRYPARGFIRRWRKTGALKLGWFHPNLLKDNDIIADFLDKTGIEAPGAYEVEQRNPSLGGNLLFMKLAANHDRQPFLSYADMTRAMMRRENFILPFRFTKERANALRAKSSFNRVFEKKIGPVPFKSWDEGAVLPDRQNLDADLAFIQENFPASLLDKLDLHRHLNTDWF